MPEPIGGVQPFAELARNGTTVVYKGYQRAHERFVLLKAVRADLGEAAGLGERLAEEARLAAQVRHPNVVAVLETGTDGPTAYLISEFVEGGDLGEIAARGPLPAELAAYVVREAARGLGAVHAGGILHRDLKPANVLVSEAGEVKLADFGLASLAPEGGDGLAEVRGTLAYLAPEVVRGEPPSARSDLFSLGAVLAELLVGRPVFERPTPGATLDAVLHDDPLPALSADPRVPPALVVLVAKLLAKDPAQRLGSAELLAEKLVAFCASCGRDGAETLALYLHDPAAYVPPRLAEPSASVVSERQPDAPPLPQPATSKRRFAGWWVGAAALVVLAALVGYLSLRSTSETPPDDLAVASEERAADPESPVDPLRGEAEAPEALLPSDEERDEVEEVPALPDERGEDERDAPPEEAASEAEEPDSEPVEGGTDSSPDTPDEVGSDPEAETLPAVAAIGSLAIVVEPWARVRVDGEEVGTTPLGTVTAPAGFRTLTFENPDFPSHSMGIVVREGETARVAVSLWDLVGRVTLAVSPWARVSVDGTYWDTVPPQDRPLILRPGAHRLVFEHPALGRRETTLDIAAGEVRTVQVNLTERTP